MSDHARYSRYPALSMPNSGHTARAGIARTQRRGGPGP